MRKLLIPLLTALVIIVSLGTAGSVCAADFAKGARAHKAGDYATALKEFTTLVKQGDAGAHHNLGLMYAQGKGVPKDYVLAYAWSSIVAARGNAHGINVQELLTKIFTPAQIAEGQKLSR